MTEILVEQIDYTIKETTSILLKLNEVYHSNLHFDMEKLPFNPLTEKIPITIDGLYVNNSYINKALCKLTHKTNVILYLNSNIKIFIHFYHNKDYDLIIKSIKRIYSMIKVFSSNEHLSKYDNAKFYIVLYEAPRIISARYQDTTEEINIIGENHYFNCTCGYAENGNVFKICVTRKNGCLGLLVHELGHICALDLSSWNKGEYNFPVNRLSGWKHIVRKLLDTSSKCRLGNMSEGINNGNSSILHAMFLAIENTSDPKITMNKELIEKYKSTYTKEFYYSIYQTVKLLRWYGYKSITDLTTRIQRKYTQKSMMLEYILIRCIYLMNFDQLDLFTNKLQQQDDAEYIMTFMSRLFETYDIIDNYMQGIKQPNKKEIVNMEYFYA